MPERFDRRAFLIIAALSPVAVLAAYRSSSEKHPQSLSEGATQADYESTFDQIFDLARQEKNVSISTRLGGPQDGIVEIEFDGGNFKGTLSLEKGYRPSNLLGLYIKDDSAKTIDLTTETRTGETNRTLASTWNNQKAIRFLPPEKYVNPEGPTVEPHKFTPQELGNFLATVYASFNAVRIPPKQ